ncbi:MAG: hypothetical protein JWO36_748 [Myxococcales bacterium]|nr:hypothetical protein [Myxococcales bacterium]
MTEHARRTRSAVMVDKAGMFRSTIACGSTAGEQWVSIDATTATASEQLALFPIYSSTTPAAWFEVEPSVNLDGISAAADAESRLTAIINRERRFAHLQLLSKDARLAVAAHRYAEVGRTAQTSAPVTDLTEPVDRLRSVGIAPAVARWTVFHADDLGRAAEYILNDPRERENVAMSAATHLGVGIAPDAGHGLYVALIYVEIPMPLDDAHLKRRSSRESSTYTKACTSATARPKLHSVLRQALQSVGAARICGFRKQTRSEGHTWWSRPLLISICSMQRR